MDDATLMHTVGDQRRTVMRNTFAVMMIAVAFIAGELDAATPKTPPADVGSGRVAWFDISTNGLPRSKEFYGRLFDWEFTPLQGTDQAVEIVAGGKAIGTLRVAEGRLARSTELPISK